MGNILRITNLNKYIGRYSHVGGKPPEERIGWTVENALHERMPVASLRNREADEDDAWPLCWSGRRETRIATTVTLETLKGWQAFRTSRPGVAQSLVSELQVELPKLVVKTQRLFLKYEVSGARDIVGLEWEPAQELVRIMAEVAGQLSYKKAMYAPMLGSKIMNFFFPEFFPVWDTAWVENAALVHEDLSNERLVDWFPESVQIRLGKLEYADPAMAYGRYVALMLKEFEDTEEEEYAHLYNVYVKHSAVDEAVVDWHFHDLAPLVFEACLLGKHLG